VAMLLQRRVEGDDVCMDFDADYGIEIRSQPSVRGR
jgi:hypothetical protein